MLTLKNNPTLKDFQDYVKQMEIERGFSKDKILEKCLLLGEEIGELFQAIKREQGILKVDCKIHQKSNKDSVSGELSDILIVLFAIAN